MYLTKNKIKKLVKNKMPKVDSKTLESLLQRAEKKNFIKKNSQGEYDADSVKDYLERIFKDKQTTPIKYLATKQKK